MICTKPTRKPRQTKAQKLVARIRDKYWATYPKGHWLRADRAKQLWEAKKGSFGRYFRGWPMFI